MRMITIMTTMTTMTMMTMMTRMKMIMVMTPMVMTVHSVQKVLSNLMLAAKNTANRILKNMVVQTVMPMAVQICMTRAHGTQRLPTVCSLDQMP